MTPPSDVRSAPPPVMVPLGVLVAAVIVEAGVLYLVARPGLRVGLGLLPVIPALWGAARLGIAWVSVHPAEEPRYQERRFVRLRILVDQFLAEVRRLNALAAVGEVGFQDDAAQKQEMDAVERRLRDLIPKIRGAAGRELPTPEYPPRSEPAAPEVREDRPPSPSA